MLFSLIPTTEWKDLKHYVIESFARSVEAKTATSGFIDYNSRIEQKE